MEFATAGGEILAHVRFDVEQGAVEGDEVPAGKLREAVEVRFGKPLLREEVRPWNAGKVM